MSCGVFIFLGCFDCFLILNDLIGIVPKWVKRCCLCSGGVVGLFGVLKCGPPNHFSVRSGANGDFFDKRPARGSGVPDVEGGEPPTKK